MEDTEVINEENENNAQPGPSPKNAEKKKNPPDHVPSQRQLEHLKYARSMKELKRTALNHEVERQNQNLDFIYRRLSNIEKSLNSMMDLDVPTHAVKRKRKSRKQVDSGSDSEGESKTKKIKKTVEISKNSSFIYDTVSPWAMKTLLVGGGAFIFSLLRQYAALNHVTSDGDPLNGYIIAKDV